MDIYCPHCGEPWDTYSFHDEAEDRADGSTYQSIAREFRQVGCQALVGARCNPATTAHPAIGTVLELLGDDVDGAAALLDDAAYLGFLD